MRAAPIATGARGHQRVVPGPVRVAVVAAIAGDRAVDQARIQRVERGEVDPQAFRYARAEAFDKHVGAPRPGSEKARRSAPRLRSRIALRLPRFHTRYPGCCRNGSPPGGSILVTSRAVIAKQHRGHRPGDAPREIEHFQSIKYARHRAASAFGVVLTGRRSKRRCRTPVFCRSAAGTPWNCRSMISRECGHEVAGCG